MKKWIVACVCTLSLGFGGAALATKDMGQDVGVKACAKCHQGKPSDKVLKPEMKKHFDACKSKGTCKSCHEGKPKGKKSC